MLGWTIFFFLVAVFNAIVGFAFFVFLGVSITTLIMHIKDVRRRSRER
jgi:hypothetical protein